MKVGQGSRSHDLVGSWIRVCLHPLWLMVDIVFSTMTILTILKDYSDFSNFILEKGAKGIYQYCPGEVKIFACVIGNLHYSIDLGDLFWSQWFGVVIRFSLRHECVACFNLGVEPTSVWVWHNPVPHTLPFFSSSILHPEPQMWSKGLLYKRSKYS